MKKSMIKYNEWCQIYLFHPDTQKIMFFMFYHSGIPNENRWPKKRIKLELIDIKYFNIPVTFLYEISSEQYIRVNSNHPDYEIIFKISIDKRAGKARLTLEKLPNMGETLITDTERKGIELSL